MQRRSTPSPQVATLQRSSLPRPPGELAALEAAWAPPCGWRRVTSVNNSHVGLLYIATALLFFVLAGVLALVMRAQLALPDAPLVSAHRYAQLFTMHGTVMMFLFAVPVVEAVAVYLLPAMLGARDLPFPRLSAYAYWAYAFGGLAFFTTIFVDVAPDSGWFLYPPLSNKTYSPGLGADFWLLGIGFIEISAIAGAIELIVGILFTRAPGMTLARMPVFAWAMLVTSLMVVLAFPPLIAGTALLELERAFDWPIFEPARGGDPLLWQHLFWFFGHPEVYIIFLPAAGIVSTLLPVMAGTPLVGRRAVVAALAAIGVLSFALWAHHMFTAGLGLAPQQIVSIASLAIAVPSAVQMFAWLATLARGRLRVRPHIAASALFVLGFLALFALGGLTGVMLATLPFNSQAHDSHFVVAHLHYVLFGGMVFPLFAALYHWAPLVNGHRLDERLGRWAAALMFVGFNLAFLPMHVSGLLGMPRRVVSYAADTGWGLWNALSSAGAFVLAAGVALVLADLARTLARPQRAHGNPWHAATLEWLPNSHYGTRSIPDLRTREPLWQQRALAANVEAGTQWLPGTRGGGRETLRTTAWRARPTHLLPLPGDSWWPLLGAFGTAAFFLLMTVGAAWLAAAGGVLALAAIAAWTWQLDRVPQLPGAEIADGVRVPVGADGVAAPAWWAAAIVIVVDATVFASMLFAHLHVSMRAEVCPPPGAALPAASWLWGAAALALASSAAIEIARRRVRVTAASAWTLALLLFAIAAALASFALTWGAHLDADLAPRADAWSATVAAMLATQGLHAVALALIGALLVARGACGLLRPRGNATLEACTMFWHYAMAQGLVLIVVVQGLPGWMEWLG